LEPVTLRLLVCEMHGPADIAVGRSELAHYLAARVVSINMKARRLALQRARSIAVESGPLGRRLHDFRTHEEIGLAVTDARNPDPGMKGRANDDVVDAWRGIEDRLRLRRLANRNAVDVPAQVGRGRVDRASRFRDRALRPVLRRHAPDIACKVLAV